MIFYRINYVSTFESAKMWQAQVNMLIVSTHTNTKFPIFEIRSKNRYAHEHIQTCII